MINGVLTLIRDSKQLFGRQCSSMADVKDAVNAWKLVKKDGDTISFQPSTPRVTIKSDHDIKSMAQSLKHNPHS